MHMLGRHSCTDAIMFIDSIAQYQLFICFFEEIPYTISLNCIVNAIFESDKILRNVLPMLRSDPEFFHHNYKKCWWLILRNRCIREFSLTLSVRTISCVRTIKIKNIINLLMLYGTCLALHQNQV